MCPPWCWWVCPPPQAFAFFVPSCLPSSPFVCLAGFGGSFPLFGPLSVQLLGVLHPPLAFVFQLSLVVLCYLPTGHLSLACLFVGGVRGSWSSSICLPDSLLAHLLVVAWLLVGWDEGFFCLKYLLLVPSPFVTCVLVYALQSC